MDKPKCGEDCLSIVQCPWAVANGSLRFVAVHQSIIYRLNPISSSFLPRLSDLRHLVLVRVHRQLARPFIMIGYLITDCLVSVDARGRGRKQQVEGKTPEDRNGSVLSVHARNPLPSAYSCFLLLHLSRHLSLRPLSMPCRSDIYLNIVHNPLAKSRIP